MSNGVKFVWKIENISCISDRTIDSPTFCFNATYKWKVLILPDESFIKVQRVDTIIFHSWKYSIAILDSKGLPLFWSEMKNTLKSDLITFPDMQRSVFGSERDRYIPNDTLVIQCIIWHTNEEIINPQKLFAASRIEPKGEVTKKTFTWNITNAIQRMKEGGYINHVESLTSNQEICIKMKNFDVILTKNFENPNVNTNFRCLISLLDAQKEIVRFAQKEGYVKKFTDNLKIHLPISLTMLEYYRNQFLPQNTLSLVFECTFTTNPRVTFDGFVEESEIFSNSNTQPNVSMPLAATDSEASEVKKADDTVSDALRSILKDGSMSDFTFRVQNETFPVHKAILGARSPVFKAMFTTAMKEKEDNSVDIPDIDADTFQRLLDFIYSDTIQQTMTSTSASSLYSAADKYAIEPLKQRCSRLLAAGLSTSSVLEVLALGDIHQDKYLKESALDFIAKNDKDIVGNEDWIRFEEEHPQLVIETFRKLYLKKLNGTGQ